VVRGNHVNVEVHLTHFLEEFLNQGAHHGHIVVHMPQQHRLIAQRDPVMDYAIKYLTDDVIKTAQEMLTLTAYAVMTYVNLKRKSLMKHARKTVPPELKTIFAIKSFKPIHLISSLMFNTNGIFSLTTIIGNCT